VAAALADRSSWQGGNMLVLGGSTGYGLSSRIAGAFGHGMSSLGVFYERPDSDKRTASAGWYNSAYFHRIAAEHGLEAHGINGDAFSDAVLDEALARLQSQLGPVDVFIYSLAAPTRTDPATGEQYRSAIKTIGEPVVTKTVDTASDSVVEVTVPAATEAEIASTVAVMGGADMERWVEALKSEELLAEGARVVSYSYVGSEITWPIYRHGTIGRAKDHLEATARRLDDRLSREIGGRCLVSVNPSVVTQAATAIPGVNLAMSILFKVMKEKGVHEEAIDLMVRLFDEHIGPGRTATTDSEGRIRIDDVELRSDIQAECLSRWERIDTGNLYELSDYAGYLSYFTQMFGFGVDGVDYEAPVETDVPLEPHTEARPDG
jgi:enoyl-[acyl-carrier protein] reductase/trans-2-enoyl-CoA reductase (NAD+)